MSGSQRRLRFAGILIDFFPHVQASSSCNGNQRPITRLGRFRGETWCAFGRLPNAWRPLFEKRHSRSLFGGRQRGLQSPHAPLPNQFVDQKGKTGDLLIDAREVDQIDRQRIECLPPNDRQAQEAGPVQIAVLQRGQRDEPDHGMSKSSGKSEN